VRVVVVVVCMVAYALPTMTTPNPERGSHEVPARFATGGHDAEAYRASAGYPKGDRTTFRDIGSLVGSHSHLDEIFPSRLIRKAPAPSRLVRIAEPRITYEFEGASLTLDDYVARTPTTGLLVARENTILVERYQYGRTDRHRFASASMAKTVTAMLVGIAIADGRIRSIDDLAATYVRELAGTEYGRTSLRHLLQMSSGIRYSEEYSGADDHARFTADTYLGLGPGGATAVKAFNDRVTPAGTRFSYASTEAQVLGLVLRAATDQPVAEYLQSKIWREIGTEADATWLIDNSGQESTYTGLNAVLRDYARLGLLLAHDGNWQGRQLIPASWVVDATTVRADQPHLCPGTADPIFGYGYQTWILPGARRMFMLWGARGQRIFVDPQSKLVMVNTAVHKLPFDLGSVEEGRALWSGLIRQLGR
jgi:CubicO group peptidase (beta-lactamase class C family)